MSYTLVSLTPSAQCNTYLGHPWWLNGEESSAKERDAGLILGSRRSPGTETGNPPQDFCLGNRIDRGAWQATVHGVVKS